ncbi:hypothetical protein Tco_0523425 [Tanacetum coccineum]
MTPPHFNTHQSSYKNPQFQQQFPPSQYGSSHPTQYYSSTYPSQPQFNHSSIPPSYPYQSQMNHQTSSVQQIAYQSPQVSTQPMTESPLVDSSFVVPFQGDKVKVILVLVIRVRLLVLGETIQVNMQGLLNATTVKTEDLDTYDSDCDDISNAKAVLMANISNYGFLCYPQGTLSFFETYLNDMENQSVHGMQDFEQTPVVDVTDNEITNSGKCFTPQQELSAEQDFLLRISNPTIESSNKPHVIVEVPSELPKVSLVNASFKKLKFHLAQFNSVVKKRTTLDACTEDIINVFDKDILNEIMEVQTVFNQMEAAVQQSSVDKQCLEIAKKELLLENDRLL